MIILNYFTVFIILMLANGDNHNYNDHNINNDIAGHCNAN